MSSKFFSIIAAFAFAATSQALADDFDDFDKDTASVSEVSSEPAEGDSTEYEDCTAADSTNVECNAPTETYNGSMASEFADDEEYAAAFAQYKKEQTSKTEINRQRAEGFARTILLGVRGSIGINTFFGGGSDGWNLGFQGAAGLMVSMPLGVKNLSMVPELVFNYRHYNYETDTDFGYNDGSVDIMMFEIPLIVRYTFADHNMFVGLGLNLGLKLSGSSEYNQNMDVGEDKTSENTIATSGFEIGGALDLGYMVTRYVHINIRVVQGFTNLLNKTLIAVKAFEDSNLLTFYATAGVSFLF